MEIPVFEDEEDPMDSPIYAFLEGNNGLGRFTNFASDTVEDLWRGVDLRMRRHRHRGPIPETSILGHLILYFYE
jgi:hypothetical protein